MEIDGKTIEHVRVGARTELDLKRSSDDADEYLKVSCDATG